MSEDQSKTVVHLLILDDEGAEAVREVTNDTATQRWRGRKLVEALKRARLITIAEPIDRGKEPASPTPWRHYEGNDEHGDPVETVEGAGRVYVATLHEHETGDAGEDAAAIVHRVNNYEAMCLRAEVAEVERDEARAEARRLRQYAEMAFGEAR